MKRNLTIAVLLAASAALYFPTAAMARVNVDVIIGTAPPPVRYEVVPAPRQGYVWAPGYWDWTGRRYVWVGGRWDYMRPGQIYYRPEWRHGPGGWHLDRGGWRSNRHHDVHRGHYDHGRRDHHDRYDHYDHHDRGHGRH